MRLLLIRHAEAHDHSPAGDSHRPLTPRGHQQARRLARALGRRALTLDLLLHSPWLRAVQTADALTPALKGETQVTPHLAASPTGALLAELRGETAAAVGHSPWLSELVAWLVTGHPEDAEHFPLKKGGLAWLEGEPQPGRMRLRGLYTRRGLRQL